MQHQKQIDELKRRLQDIAHFNSALGLLVWDQEVNLPRKAVDSRAETISYLSGVIHNKFIQIDSDDLLSELKRELDTGKIKGKDAVIVFETWRSYEREKKLPEDFVKELARVTSKAQSIWAEARKKNDFELFLPWLTNVVDLKRKEALYIGYTDSPYDALLDQFEPGMTAQETSRILNDLKDFLIPFVKKITDTKQEMDQKKFLGNFPIERQKAFNEFVAKQIGYDTEAGRLDISTHPFSTSFHPYDARITTRYKEDDVLYSLGSTIHETGHALYEQGFSAEHFGTPLAESISLGIHESQSRLWENQIGKSKSFWKHFYPKLQEEFPIPFKDILPDDFYRIYNEVKPSLIRTESDEVTYNLHIILRYEIEKEMIEGAIDLKELPSVWESKMKDYFGLTVPNDSVGVLQDVHWSNGGIGYFPTYSFGNLYAAQLFASMKKQIPGLDESIANGQFTEIREWLRENVHVHGKTYTAAGLIKKISGEELTSFYFIDYLEKKYSEIYGL